MSFQRYNFLFFALIINTLSYAQRGKNNDYSVPALNTVVNTYTSLTINGNQGYTNISVTNNTMTGAGFTSNLEPGDLIMIIQMYGATTNIDWFPGTFGGSTGILGIDPSLWYANGAQFGSIDAYNNAGQFEVREVLSVSGSTNINLTCALESTYFADNTTQVIRIPRYNNLTVPTNTSIVPALWDGDTGGVVAIEVNGNLQINGTGKIEANGAGFRPGLAFGTSITGNSTPHTNGAGNGDSPLGQMNPIEGGAKGESIVGFTPEYSNVFISSLYGRGAIANGGGGGGYQNAGGGGGSNIGTGTFTGKGLPTPGYIAAWNLELAGFASTNSPGGGRGGYTYATQNMNELTIGPNQAAWGGNCRKENGGYGGHPLQTAPNRLFLGGGGGAGGQDSQQGGSGGRGGGIVHLTVYGTISGNGSVQANGQNGQNSNPLNEPTPGTFSAQKKGNDGAGGGGGGGHVYIKNMNPIPATISLQAVGGEGGDQDLRLGGFATDEAGGPGAGGGGGGISFSSGTPIQSVIGGTSGITLENLGSNTLVNNFPPNGATNGGSGISSIITPVFTIIASNDTICGSQSTTLTASIQGTSSGGNLQWFSVPFGGSVLATGNSYTTPILSTTTTYYVGICPGTFRIPVTVVVGQNPIISGIATITDATCTTPGSITGLTASGGIAPLSYSWNGTSYPNANLPSAATGSYMLTVSDANGCSSTGGPYTISGTALPSIIGTATITNQTCTVSGSILGLTGTGGTGTLSYSWNGTSTPTGDLSTATAGSYTLTVTDQAGCSAQSQPYTIALTAGPTINGVAVVTNETCSVLGSITGLTVSGGLAPYTYEWSGTAYPSADLPNASTGNYMLEVTDANGCVVSSSNIFVGIETGPSFTGTAAITDVTCSTTGAITGIGVTGGLLPYTYSWNGNSSPSSDYSGPAGDLVLTVTDDNGCIITSQTYTVDSIPPPTIDLTNLIVANELCSDQNASISGIEVTGGTPTYIYLWNNVPSSDLDMANLNNGSYTLVVTDQAGCVVNGGTYVITDTPPPTIDTSNMVITDATCSGSLGSITGITASGNNLVYQWTNATGNIPDGNDLAPGGYGLTVTDTGTGCSAQTFSLLVEYIDGPTINQSNVVQTNPSCNGTMGSINGIVASGTGNLTYEWTNTNQTTLNLNGLNAGTYTLTITDDATGCTITSSPQVLNFIEGPEALFEAIPSNPEPGDLVNFNDLSSGNVVAWNWQMDGQNQVTQDANYTFESLGEYLVSLTVTDQNGCTDNYSINLIIGNDVIVPNVITMNNDGQNDFFEIKYLNPNSELLILNRWGNEVFYSKSYANEWKGNDKTGLELSEGVYTYILKLPNGNQLHGFIHLVK